MESDKFPVISSFKDEFWGTDMNILEQIFLHAKATEDWPEIGPIIVEEGLGARAGQTRTITMTLKGSKVGFAFDRETQVLIGIFNWKE